MSSGSAGNQTVTQKSTPSPYLTPSIGNAANEINQQFGGSSPVLNAGQVALANRGLRGSPILGDANQLTRDTLQGSYLNSNPYLDQTFNRAADLTRTRLSSEFAGAGRNIGASLPARSDELQTLASQIYGNNYARERGIQSQAVNQALPLANQDYTDISAVLDAGNFNADNLINRIQALAPAAGGTATTAQPLYRNSAAGALGGAASGAALGSKINPGWGTAIGAGLGGLFGYFA